MRTKNLRRKHCLNRKSWNSLHHVPIKQEESAFLKTWKLNKEFLSKPCAFIHNKRRTSLWGQEIGQGSTNCLMTTITHPWTVREIRGWDALILWCVWVACCRFLWSLTVPCPCLTLLAALRFLSTPPAAIWLLADLLRTLPSVLRLAQRRWIECLVIPSGLSLV